MKNIIFAAVVGAAAFSSSMAFAENPTFGIPAELRQGAAVSLVSASFGAPSISLAKLQNAGQRAVNPAANRFGDAQPRN